MHASADTTIKPLIQPVRTTVFQLRQTSMAVEFNAGEILETLFRHKWKLVFIPVTIVAMTIAVLLFFPRTYQSEAKLFLRVGRETVGLDPTATTGATISLMQSDRDEEVKSAIDVLSSRGLIAQVVDKLTPDYILSAGASEDGEVESNVVTATVKQAVGQVVEVMRSIDHIDDRERAIIEMEKNLEVEADRKSTVLTLAYDSESPKAAQKILSTLVELYQAEHLRIHRNPETGSFLSEQQTLLKTKWDEATMALSDAKSRTGVVSINGRREGLEQQLQAVELAQIETRQLSASALARMNDIKKQLTDIPARETTSQKLIPNEGADLMREELYANQIKLMEYRSRLTPGHPLLIATEKQVEQAKLLVEEQAEERRETVDDINPVHRELQLDLRKEESQLAGIQARLEQLDKQYAQLQDEMKRFNRYEIEIQQLEQNEQIARDKFVQYTNTVEQARMDEALEADSISSVSVVQNATMAEKPISPSKAIVLLGGLFMAFACSVGAIFVAEKLDDRLRRERDVQQSLGLPVLTTLVESGRNRRLLAR
ncbi:MAG: GumC family protein [Pirellulales bacterium]